MTLNDDEKRLVQSALISYTTAMQDKLRLCVEKGWPELAKLTQADIDGSLALRNRLCQ